MSTLRRTTCDSGLARTLAAEDIRQGDVVAVLDAIHEYPSFLWHADANMFPPQELVCVRQRDRRAGRPLKVQAVCLPFVLVKTPNGRHKTLDVRQYRLVRLSDGYARKAWKHLRTARNKNAPTANNKSP